MKLPEQILYAEDLAFYIRSQLAMPDSGDFAFIIGDENVYWAQAPLNDNKPHALLSAVTELIQGLFAQYTDQAFFNLRKRIFTTAPARLVCRNMVKVAAKRMHENLAPRSHSELNQDWTRKNFEKISTRQNVHWQSSEREALSFWPESKFPTTDAEFLRLSLRLAASVERGSILHRYDRDVGCLITDGHGQILVAAVNRSALDKTRHAEFNACELWWEKTLMPLPKGSRIYVSLKPCRMCAAALIQVSGFANDIKVFYAENDGGSFARNTALDRLSSSSELMELKIF